MSFGAIDVVATFLSQLEVTHMQAVNKFFYSIAISRVQTRCVLRSQRLLFTRTFSNSTLKNTVVEVTRQRNAGQTNDETIENLQLSTKLIKQSFCSANWCSVQVGDTSIFQLENGGTGLCRMLV